jgi:hypothetical protein
MSEVLVDHVGIDMCRTFGHVDLLNLGRMCFLTWFIKLDTF